MKTKIEITTQEKFVPRFPLIAKRKEDGLIFLFTDQNNCIYLHSNHKFEDSFMIGHQSNSGSTCFDTQVWVIIPEITITFYS